MNHTYSPALFALFLVLLCRDLSAQVITITFNGEVNGTPTQLDSVRVLNLEQGGETTLYFPDLFLVLGSVGMKEETAHTILPMRSMPNPFATSTEVVVDVTAAGELALALHDATGRLIASHAARGTAGTHRFRVSCAQPGVHHLSATLNGTRRTTRLIATQGGGAAGLYPMGGSAMGRAKGGLPFSWNAGEELRYIGYATSGAVVHSAAVQEVPTITETITFGMIAGIVCAEVPTVWDIDGNAYATVEIGDQCWMAENLRTGSYRDGTPIPEVQENAAWGVLTSGAWCAYANDPSNEALYGMLYNWYAVDDHAGLCPQGWHVPTDDEWKELESTLGMPESELDESIYRGVDANVGGQIKSTSTLWIQPNLGANDQWGFTAQPGGLRDPVSNTFQLIGDNGTYWSHPEFSASSAMQRILSSYDQGVIRLPDNKRAGAGVRCVLD